MAEPISTIASTSALTVLALLSTLPGVDFSVVLGALTGALLFVATTNEPSLWRKIFLSIASFFSGLLAADLASQLLTAVLPTNISVSNTNAVATLIASAITVRLLQAFIRNQDRLLGRFLNKGETP